MVRGRRRMIPSATIVDLEHLATLFEQLAVDQSPTPDDDWHQGYRAGRSDIYNLCAMTVRRVIEGGAK